MKNSLRSSAIMQFTYVLLLMTVVFLVASCSRKVGFTTSSVVPAAEGKVKVKKDNNSNYAINIDVKHLAEPSRLPQPHGMYVVWIETERNGVQNLGQLNTSSGLLSSTMKASMEAVTPYKPTRLFITGENAANVQYPSGYTVLNTSAF